MSEPRVVRRVGVIGAGTMGAGITDDWWTPAPLLREVAESSRRLADWRRTGTAA